MHLKQKQTFSTALGEARRGFCAMEKRRGRSLGRALKAAVFLFMVGTLGAMLFPVGPGSAATDDVEVELEVEPTIEMAMDKTSLILIDQAQCETGDTEAECAARGMLPVSTGTQVSANMNVYVTTNAANGYSLSVYTLSPTNEMKHINSSVTADINPTVGQRATLATNTWGVKYGSSGNWMAVGANENSQTTITDSGGRTSGICTDIMNKTGVNAYESCVSAGTAEKNTITFGANITDALPSGRYTNDVVFSVVAKTANRVGGN